MAELDIKADWIEADIDRPIATLSPDVFYTFQENSVDKQIQAKLGDVGFKTIAALRGLGDTRVEVKEVISASLGK